MFNLVFQLFFFFNLSLAELFLQISRSAFFFFFWGGGVHFRVSGAARCVLEFILVALTFLVEEPSDQPSTKNSLFEFYTDF